MIIACVLTEKKRLQHRQGGSGRSEVIQTDVSSPKFLPNPRSQLMTGRIAKVHAIDDDGAE